MTGDLDVAELRRVIEAAFDGVPPPGPGSRTLHQAEAADSYETCGRERDHFGRWQELPRQHLEDCPSATSYLDAEGLRYYAPAIMCASLEADGPGMLIAASLSSSLSPGDAELRAYARARLRGWDRAQRLATAAWMRHDGADPSVVVAWERAAEVEGDAWFDVWWPDRARPDADAVRRGILAAFGDAVHADPVVSASLDELDADVFPAALAAACLRVLNAPAGAGSGGAEDTIREIAGAVHPRWGTPERTAVLRRLGPLNRAQRGAVASFLDRYVENEALRRMWARVANVDAEDWLRLLAG